MTDIRGERTKRCLDKERKKERKKKKSSNCPVTPLQFTDEASRYDKKIISLIVIVPSSCLELCN